ncbi:MAG: ABC transporter permease [Propionibacteriaceae bacterium]|jgi:peptide/nickel transport system permease protein|nr:ABC transporter permease [Propionibacteriaceae bacterium]
MATTDVESATVPAARVRSRAARWASWRWSVVLAGLLLGLAVVAAVWPSLLTPIDPLRADPLQSNLPPSAQHWAGTDLQGRDLLARIVYGARYSLVIGLGAVLVSVLVGTVLGLLAGAGPSWLDQLISRAIDILCAFPSVLLALVFIAFTGPGVPNLILALGLGGIPSFARVVRSQVFVARTSGYAEQARTYAVPAWRIVLRHVLPNALGPLPILATLGLGGAIVGSSGLSFLGLGPQPPAAEWGLMLSDSRNYLRVAWWTGVFPGVALTAVVISATVVGRWLQRRYERRF